MDCKLAIHNNSFFVCKSGDGGRAGCTFMRWGNYGDERIERERGGFNEVAGIMSLWGLKVCVV